MRISQIFATIRLIKSTKKLLLSSETFKEEIEGLFIVTSFNKHFSNSTIILPDNAQSLFGSFIDSCLQSNNFSRSQPVKMDNPEFEKEFVVYGTDQIEARYPFTLDDATYFRS
ncbi:MAG: DUF3137 domain-containing protein [Thiovulaceae bacterium]|nr:DUF3137 domain-containing protein [Sulfurimonadaceae bacterium]